MGRLLPAGYVRSYGRIHEKGGRMLTVTGTRILLYVARAANPKHLWRGSVGVQKATPLWGGLGWASGSGTGTSCTELVGGRGTNHTTSCKAKLCSIDSRAEGGAAG